LTWPHSASTLEYVINITNDDAERQRCQTALQLLRPPLARQAGKGGRTSAQPANPRGGRGRGAYSAKGAEGKGGKGKQQFCPGAAAHLAVCIGSRVSPWFGRTGPLRKGPATGTRQAMTLRSGASNPRLAHPCKTQRPRTPVKETRVYRPCRCQKHPRETKRQLVPSVQPYRQTRRPPKSKCCRLCGSVFATRKR
jgi:hypothetical protein